MMKFTLLDATNELDAIVVDAAAPSSAADLPETDAVYETTICRLAPGQTGIVVRVQGEASLRAHLLEMGFTRGTRIEFLRRAPLGDPIDVKLRGYRLSVREREACSVVVAAVPLPAPARKRFGLRRRGK